MSSEHGTGGASGARGAWQFRHAGARAQRSSCTLGSASGGWVSDCAAAGGAGQRGELFQRQDLARDDAAAAGAGDRQLPGAARGRPGRPPGARHRPLPRAASCSKRTAGPKSIWSSSFTAARRSTCRPRRSSWCRSTSAAARAGPVAGEHRRQGLGAAEGGGRGGGHRPGRRHARAAGRARRRGRASPFRADTDWQREFDASFPYQETPDQLTAIDAIKRDMQQPRPMDRLLCGDVGFGKTELAMRAAFKAVDAGYQVAVLVPTTILAEQHLPHVSRRGWRSFRSRSPRCRGSARAKEQREIVDGLADGHGRHRDRHASAGAAGRARFTTWAW